MKRFPMMLQLTLILFFVMALPMTILTWYSGTQMLRNSESAIAEASLAGLNASRRLNENALNNVAQDVVRLAPTRVFDRIRHLETFEELNENYNNVRNAQIVLSELFTLNHRVDGVYSTFFYLDGTDYVISTDKGITQLDRYESMDWMEEALAERVGISGVWYPRKLASGVNVVSYVLPLNRLSTTTRGTIVVNVQESQISNYVRSSEPGNHGYLLVESDGTVVSHPDKEWLLTDASEQPYIQEILRKSSREGYAFYEAEGERFIYTWSRSPLQGWVTIHIYSMDELLIKTLAVQRGIHVLTALIIAAGAVLTVFLATWVSKPARQLVRAVRARNNLKVANKNELVFLDAAFQRMQEKEEALHKLLKERVEDTRSLAVHNLLRGEVADLIAEMFPASHYRVAIVSVDRYRRYVSHTNRETRNYHRYLLVSQCETLFPEPIQVRAVYYGDGNFVVVMNYSLGAPGTSVDDIYASLDAIREKAADVVGRSVTIGVSRETGRSASVSDRFAEAMEVMKQRMIGGGGGITFWKEEDDRSRKYIYPANGERRILNFLATGDLGSIRKELEVIRKEIQSVEYIAYDNILFIYNQIVGVTIKHLRENNISTARIFAGWGNIYSAMASMDTLDELEEFLHKFFGEIVEYLSRTPAEINYGERIVRYLTEHYREDIVFEEMAKEIGISYSYMRKIAYEATGKSLIDYMNMLRIEEAKRILLQSNLSMGQIASEVGYANVQSFNRFFRKFEGMPPSAFKVLKYGGPASERESL
ncbi:helix-turn-helix domain-containing protein [Paenibacillus sp. TRM 82003]|nr:helix-turn-helix domain-containing protein [Paenibacillus sp. TRM 82003]